MGSSAIGKRCTSDFFKESLGLFLYNDIAGNDRDEI